MEKIKKPRTNPEKLICQQFKRIFDQIISLKQTVVDNVLWYHVPNGQRSGDTINRVIHGQIDKSMGALKGVPDYIFIWRAPYGDLKIVYFEFKAKHGGQSQPQKDFEAKCQKSNVPYYVIRSIGQAIEILKESGLIKNNFKI